MARTTPPRPVDVSVEFPELAGSARTAVRLHPVPGAPTVHDSSVGGPLLWPADEEWPVFESPGPPFMPVTTLADIRELRTLLTLPEPTPAQRLAVTRLMDGYDAEDITSSGPMPLIPVAQLYARDVPGLPFPEGTDVLQVLWLPLPDIEGCWPAVQLRWRAAAEVRQVLAEPPEPAYVELDDHVPQPCLLQPEEILEFPPLHLLGEELQQRITAWSKRASLEYQWELSVAPGWKAGGWPAEFTFRDPAEPDDELCCGECGGPVEALLTVGGGERGSGGGSWTAVELRELVEADPGAYPLAYEPTRIQIGRGYVLQFYYCLADPRHLPRTIMQ
ncbi:hypothetical protein ACIP98_29435 [Streptomyces sp. NPDC088354]|uniref:hypothetical protein n=1 Tax=Streptomyces sp. NPDC088354 TaxID=3365856 RepID=UPI003813C2F6